MKRIIVNLLFWMAILVHIAGCFTAPVSSKLMIKGVKGDIDKTNVLSYKILFNQASFNLPNNYIQISPFKLGFDPFSGKKDLFFRLRNLHAAEGTIRLAEFYEGNELFLFVANEARHDFLFLEGYSINPEKKIDPNQHGKSESLIELEIITPKQTRISVKPGQTVVIKANGEPWELALIDCFETSPEISSGAHPVNGFAADFIAYKLAAVNKKR